MSAPVVESPYSAPLWLYLLILMIALLLLVFFSFAGT
jgi:hypothetical protein